MTLARVNSRRPRQDVLRSVKGCLEVRAVRDTACGLSDKLVPVDSVGFVIAAPAGTGRYLITWPSFLEDLTERALTSSHPTSDVAPTGRRG